MAQAGIDGRERKHDGDDRRPDDGAIDDTAVGIATNATFAMAVPTSTASISTSTNISTSTSTNSTSFGAQLQAAMAGGYVAHLTGGTYTVTSPIVINVTSTIQGALGIDGGGATLVSQITDGSPVIEINVAAGVDLRYLTLSNFKIEGSGQEGDGIKIVADGNDRWVYNWSINNVTVEHVGGIGLDVQGSVFEGMVSNSWMIGNAGGGASFADSAGGGVASALRWFGGGFEDNGGAGLALQNGARDMSVDGATFIGNQGAGIYAETGITSVHASTFEDNQGAGVWFQGYGNFSNDTFSTSGAQTIGIDGYLAGQANLIDNTSTYSGAGADPTELANLQGNGAAVVIGGGNVVTGPDITLGGYSPDITVGTNGVAMPVLAATASIATTVGTAATADSGTSTGFGAALKAAMDGDYVARLTQTTYTVTAPIVIHVTSNAQAALGIDGGGAKLISEITDGSPVIEIDVAAGVDVSNLTLSNFSIEGNGAEGDGIRIVTEGAGSKVDNWTISNVNVEHVGGIGLNMQGNISQGAVFESWMNGNAGGGARFAGTQATGLEWTGGGFRLNGVAGLILDDGAHDMTVKGAYFVENNGPGIDAPYGITLVQESGFENNQGVGAVFQQSANFTDDTFSTGGNQTVGIGGYLAGQAATLIGNSSEYYGGGENPTVLANLQGNGSVAMVGGGSVIAAPNVTIGAYDPADPPPVETAPTVSSITTSGVGISDGAGDLNAGKTVTLTMTLSETVSVAGGVPTLLLNDGGTATYAGGSGSSALIFAYTVQAGQNVADLAVSSISLNGATIADGAGNAADLSGAANYNPTGTLQIDTTPPQVTEGLYDDTGASSTDGITSNVAITGGADPNAVVQFTIDGNPYPSVATANADGVWWYAPTGLADGVHTIVASETDLAGNTGSASLTFTLDTTPPQVTEGLYDDTGASSTDGITFNPTVTGGGDPNAVMHFMVDGNPIVATTTANSSGAWSFTPTGLADGVHTIVASETDLAGNTGSASLTFTLDTTPPQVTEGLYDDTGASSTDGITSNVAITGGADPNAVVQFTIDGNPYPSVATANADGVWWYAPTGLADGVHTIVASETDLAGNTGSASLTFTLDTHAPVSSITNEVVSNGEVALTGATGEANDAISVFDGTTLLGTTTTDNNGTWSFNVGKVSDAVHTYTANATDLAGNVGQSTNEAILGSSKADTLVGTSGNDIIDGNGGNDTLTGGAGSNTFLFSTALNAATNVDTITDFSPGSDQFALDHSVFSALPTGSLSPLAFVQAVAALTPDQHVIYNQTTGIVSYDADGSGPSTAVPFAQVTPGEQLTSQNFKVV